MILICSHCLGLYMSVWDISFLDWIFLPLIFATFSVFLTMDVAKSLTIILILAGLSDIRIYTRYTDRLSEILR